MQRHSGLTTKEGMTAGINEWYKIQKIMTMPVNTLVEANSLTLRICHRRLEMWTSFDLCLVIAINVENVTDGIKKL